MRSQDRRSGDNDSVTESHDLLGIDNEATGGRLKSTHTAISSQWSWALFDVHSRRKFYQLNLMSRPHLSVKSLCLLIAISVLAVFAYIPSRAADSLSPSLITPVKSASPFSGAFARFPNVSALPPRHRRITLIAVWNNDAYPSYLRHFFYTVQLNIAYIDLVMINRKLTPDAQCLDLAKHGVDINQGNINFHCMDNDEYQRRHVDFLCSQEHGWSCNQDEYNEVIKAFRPRSDSLNVNFRPLQGYIFRDLFLNPENPLWAWTDVDSFIGDFARYPFNVLSQISFMTGSHSEPRFLFLAGQFTAFNLDDIALATAWKKFPPLKTAAHFTKQLEGSFSLKVKEERYWSWGYMRSEDDLPGTDLSYVIFPGLQGDDYFGNEWMAANATETYVISGKDIFLVSASFSREQIEDLIKMERANPIDDLGGIGWTTGEDGSAYLVEQPYLGSDQAKTLAVNSGSIPSGTVAMHTGIVEDIELRTLDCRLDRNPEMQCVTPHFLTKSRPQIMRSSLVRFKEQQPMHLLRRLERDKRPRGYERKILKHHSRVKKLDWFEFPSWDITESLVLRHNAESIEVWEMGPTRDETLFYRGEGKQSIDIKSVLESV